MIYAILDKLENDIELSSLLGANQNDTRIYPLKTVREGECLVYVNTPVVGGDVKENRLELKIIGSNIDNITMIEKRLLKLLDMKEYDKGFRYENISIMKSFLSGGGILDFDDIGLTEKILYFTVKWREREV